MAATISSIEAPFWRRREVGPALTPDYFDQVRRFFAAVKSRRLRLVWSQGDVQVIGDRAEFMPEPLKPRRADICERNASRSAFAFVCHGDRIPGGS